MLLIGSIPEKSQGFFKPMKNKFLKPAYYHFWAFVLAMSISSKPRKIIHLTKGQKRSKHRTAVADFLKKSPWDEIEVLDVAAWQVLSLMKPRRGETMYLVIDDTKQSKRGKVMAAVGKLFDHVMKKFTNGHTVLTACIVFRGITLPLKVKLYGKKEFCRTAQAKNEKIKFMPLTQMAAQVIRTFNPPAGVKVFVLFDSFYLCQDVVKSCTNKGFTFISVAKSNRKFSFLGKVHKIRKYLKNLLRHKTQRFKLPSAQGWHYYRTAIRDGHLSKVGDVRLVASRRNSDNKIIALVTNNRMLSAKEIIMHYEYRWNIEVLFKQFKQNLGWGDYQIRSYRGIVRHLHLVAITYLMLTHLGLKNLGAKARKPNIVLSLPSITSLQDEVRKLIWLNVKERIINSVKDQKIIRRLENYLCSFAA